MVVVVVVTTNPFRETRNKNRVVLDLIVLRCECFIVFLRRISLKGTECCNALISGTKCKLRGCWVLGEGGKGGRERRKFRSERRSIEK